MKKNITINLFGSLYAIDDDAYELLEKYLDNTKRYFSKRDGGEEISDDIEHRVAELFAEYSTRGIEAINIEHVQEIIKRIGNPEEMDEDENVENDTNEKNTDTCKNTSDNDNYSRYFGGRRLYRNPDKQIVGGVLSGLCTYFGGNDPLPWRIIFVILALFTKIIPFVLIYLILWAIIPMAITSEDKLKMKGKPVNMNTLNEEIMNDPIAIQEGKMMGVLNTLITIIGFCLKLFFGFLICLCILSLLIAAIGLMLGYITPFTMTGHHWINDSEVEAFLYTNTMISEFTWTSLISAILFSSTLLFSIIHSIIKKNTGERMSTPTRITMIIITIVSLILSIGFGIATNIEIDKFLKDYKRETNTINGVYLLGNQHQMLAENGWDIMAYDNASENLYHGVESFYDNDYEDYFRFSRKDSQLPMNINLRRLEDYPAGDYHIEAIALARSNGAYIYAKNDSSVITSVMIPVNDGDDNGTMNNMKYSELEKTAFHREHDSNDPIIQEKMSSWSYVRSETFHHAGGPISYGITNIGSVIGRDDKTVPAWRFSLRKIKIVEDK